MAKKKNENTNINILILGVATFADSSSGDEADAGTDDPFKIMPEIDPDQRKRSQLICTSAEDLFMENIHGWIITYG